MTPETPRDQRRPRSQPTVSANLPSGALVEMVYDAVGRKSEFIVWDGDSWRRETAITLDASRLVPYSPNNNLFRNEVVLLPSAPEDYGSDAKLVGEIQDFIHRYTDLSSVFEQIASHYVLLSWIYDRFNELPYLRFRGDPGTGKTRSLLIVGSLCYKPIFASGASTVSPLFRILDAVRGTLIIDEGDFRFSDERAEIAKILNQGNARGFPVLRSEATPQREFNPTAYAVFGPKLVATRGYFDDRALESRFVTEEMGQGRLREDIPISLPREYKDEALRLRNKLLLFRFRNSAASLPAENLVDRSIEPRLNQIFVPLLSIVVNQGARDDIMDLAKRYNRELVAERGMDAEAHILEIIRDVLAADGGTVLSVKDITSRFIERHEGDYDRKITTKWIGGIIRRRLQLRTQKSHGVFVIPGSEKFKLARLYERYGVDPDRAATLEDMIEAF
jgi:hypothetical protein